MPLTNKLIFSNNSGNVGIGTTNPTKTLSVNGSFSFVGTNASFDSNDANSYPRFSGVSASAQLGLFRGSGGSEGGFYLGGDSTLFSVWSSSFSRLFNVTSSGNVGIGAISPNMEVQTKASGGLQAINDNEIVLRYNMYYSSGDKYIQAANKASSLVMNGDGHFLFYNTNTASTSANSAVTGLTERARITSGGYFKVSNNGSYIDGVSGTYHELNNNAADDVIRVRNLSTSNPYGIDISFSGASPDNNTQYFLLCRDNAGGGTNRCFIYSDGDLANHDGVYGTISDQKLKQDIVDAGSQWNDIKAIRFRKYRMKSDVAVNPDAPALLGVVAQELEQVSPGLVDEHPDKDAEGNNLGTMTKTVKSSILLMKAAVALQEAMARIEQLETKVATLEEQLKNNS